MKAWPIDPLDLRDLKLEVSEKLPCCRAADVVSFSAAVRPALVGARGDTRRAPACGDTVELRGSPESSSYQAARGNAAVARVTTRGTVTTLEIGRSAGKVLPARAGAPTDNLQRLGGGGVRAFRRHRKARALR